jgi:hypothetical protein
MGRPLRPTSADVVYHVLNRKGEDRGGQVSSLDKAMSLI